MPLVKSKGLTSAVFERNLQSHLQKLKTGQKPKVKDEWNARILL